MTNTKKKSGAKMKINESRYPQKLDSDKGYSKEAWCYLEKGGISIHINTLAGTTVSTQIPLSKLRKWIKP